METALAVASSGLPPRTPWAWAASYRASPYNPAVVGHPTQAQLDLEGASDEQLIAAARAATPSVADGYLEALYSRYHRKVAVWCLRIRGDRDEAADLAQEVFLRVHSRLDSFRMESRFSTWLYTVVRSVAINRGIGERRREAIEAREEDAADPRDPAPDPREVVEGGERLERLRRALEEGLEPLEAKVLYLHHVDGLTLPAITSLLKLGNRSGAKAHLVSGMRKLRQRIRDDDGPSGKVRRSE